MLGIAGARIYKPDLTTKLSFKMYANIHLNTRKKLTVR